MRIITISREFGSGGRELGKRLADHLAFDYYDNEIISEIAENKGIDEDYVTEILENQAWRNIPITYSRSFQGIATKSVQIDFLLEQKCVIEEIAKLGKDCVIIGRNADEILREYEPFNLFICADMESKMYRIRERAPEGEELTEKDIKRNIREVDKNRARTRDIISGSKWGQRDCYHLTVNTSAWIIKELAPAIADFAESWFIRTKPGVDL